MRKADAAQEELRTKIKMVLEANGQPMTVREVITHPTMSGKTGQQVGQTMRYMKELKFANKRWTIGSQKKTKVVRPKKRAKAGVKRRPYKNKQREQLTKVVKEWIESKIVFWITKDSQLMLKVNGVAFPVEIE